MRFSGGLMVASSEVIVMGETILVTCSTDMVNQVEEDGYALVRDCLDEETAQRLGFHLSATSHAKRNLLALAIVRELAGSLAVRSLAEALLGKNCFAVKGTFFNKTRGANGKVAWHQDLTIMVRERKEVAGFGPWTIKEGIVHVQPTADVLSRILREGTELVHAESATYSIVVTNGFSSRGWHGTVGSKLGI
jgi:hypothetical protein